MNANDYIEEVRDLLNDPNGRGWGADQILRHVSGYAERFFARARCANEEMFTKFNSSFLSEADFTVDPDDPRYSYAEFDNHVVTNITGVWLRRGSVRELMLNRNSREESGFVGRSLDVDFHQTSAIRYDLVGNRFELHGVAPGTFTIEVSYERVPPRLLVGLVDTANHGGTDSTFTLLYTANPVSGEMDREPNRYIGTRLQSLGTSYRTLREITGWAVDSTKVTVTLRGLAPEIVPASNVATIPEFPEDFHHLLALGGATQAAGVRGASKLYGMLKQQRDEAFQQAIILLEQRSSEVRWVNDTR